MSDRPPSRLEADVTTLVELSAPRATPTASRKNSPRRRGYIRTLEGLETPNLIRSDTPVLILYEGAGLVASAGSGLAQGVAYSPQFFG